MATTRDAEIGEQSPLISNEKPLEHITGTTKAEKAVAGFSAVSFGASFAAILFEHNPIVYLSGLIGIILSPYAVIQQQKITHVEALAETNKRVRDEVNQLMNENEKLQAQVADLNKSVENLKLQKGKLDTLNSVQGASLDKLEKQLEESKKICGKMKLNLQGEILNNIIDIAFMTDCDGDRELSDEEIEEAIQRLEGINGVELNNDGIRKAIVQSGRSIEAIMDLIRNLLRDDIPLEENLFRFVEKK